MHSQATIMRTINIHEAKTHLSRLVEDAAAGEEIILAKAGRPLARLVPLGIGKAVQFGLLKNTLIIPGDFDAPLPDTVLADFEGSD